MKITEKKYVIITKEYPLKFNNEAGYDYDDIEDSCFYHSAEDADYYLSNYFDEPEKYQVIKVDITYEF